MNERDEAVDVTCKPRVAIPEDRRRTVEDRICTLYHIANTLQLIADTEYDCGREDIVSGPLRFLSNSLRTEASALHHGLDTYLGDPCPMKPWSCKFTNGLPNSLSSGERKGIEPKLADQVDAQASGLKS